ncbi:AMP-binding protein [candidate division NPL-UPA2 bacterium]|nr:AMP-binding protein [candidate division NPL-UPA2 bacterium]
MNESIIQLGEILQRSAKKYGKKSAVWYEGKEISYIDFNRNANRFANALTRHGIKKGDIIAIMLPNIPEFLYAFFGAQRAGVVVVTLNPMFKGGEIIHILNDSEAKLLVTLGSFVSIINEIRPEVPNLEHIVITGERDVLLAHPESNVFIQMIYDSKEFPDLEEAYHKVAQGLLKVFHHFEVKDAWYKHWGGIRVGGKKIAAFGFARFEEEDIVIMNAMCLLSRLNIEDFFKAIWVPREVKDKFLEPLTSIEEETGVTPNKDAFKEQVIKDFQEEFDFELKEDNILGRDESFGYEKQRTLAFHKTR